MRNVVEAGHRQLAGDGDAASGGGVDHTEPSTSERASAARTASALAGASCGLFTGAEDIMTAEQAACYHAACEMAHAILTFAMTTSAVQGIDKSNDRAAKYAPAFRGSSAIK